MRSRIVFASLSVASMLVFARAFLPLKLSLLALFILNFLVAIYLKKAKLVVYSRLVWFYLWTAIAGLIWVFVGLLHSTNYLQASFDALRIYVIWSLAFLVLYTLLRAMPSLRVFHIAMVVAGILIPLINFALLYDKATGADIIPESARDQMGLEVGLWDTYIQIGSVNILSMFLVAPYLLALQFRSDAGKNNSVLTKVALGLSLVLVALSGRRALWVVVALTPCALLILSLITGSYAQLKRYGRVILIACSAVSVIALSTAIFLPEGAFDNGSITRFQEAFSVDDARTIQRPYLIEAFRRYPIFGSGFGGRAAYVRSDEQPWGYELTYYQMLFNLGIVGMTLLVGLFGAYFVKAVGLLRRFQDESAIPFCLLLAFLCLLAGAYSNPYFGGFDSLFFAGLLPYISTFEHGFASNHV